MNYIIKGTFIDTPTFSSYRVQNGYAIIENGILVKIVDNINIDTSNYQFLDYSNSIIIPGMIDLHLHAPQYSYCGTAMDKTLLDWLQEYTYPEEGKYKDKDYALKGAKYFVNDLLKTTTTRACIFNTIFTESTLILMNELEKSGIIAYVGKLSMNRNAPDYYLESKEEGIKETLRWIEESKKFNRVMPMITPRFTPSVTDDYMEELGIIANKYHITMQSHLNESAGEIAWVKELCPDAKNYSETYNRYGLFGNNVPTVMAHCIYCNDEENKLIKDNGVYVAHCPTSNENVLAGICPSAYYLRNNYHIGLGSDVAGGHTLHLHQVMATAVAVSKLRTLMYPNSEKALSLCEAFYMATVGGGSFFGKVGLFERGYDFDAVIINYQDEDNPRTFSIEEKIERFCYTNKGTIKAKFVKGFKAL